MRRDAQTGEPREREEGERGEGGRGEGVVEKYPMDDCCSCGERVQRVFKESKSGPRLAGRGRGWGRREGEEIERLGQAHPPREGLPEGDPVRV